MRCASGHGFDVARQGYVNLLSGKASVDGDSADMVAARAAVLDAGHYALESSGEEIAALVRTFLRRVR